jgi:hypothetical protein
MHRYLISAIGAFLLLAQISVGGGSGGTTLTGYTDGGDPVAGTGLDLWQFDQTVGIADGSDTYAGLVIGLTNADHTSTGNFVYGLEVEGLTGDAQATEYAITIGDGWDREIHFSGQNTDFELSDVLNSITNFRGGSVAGGGILMTLNGITQGSPTLNIASQLRTDGAKTSLAIDLTALGAMNGSDTWSFIDITAFTDSNHTGATNVLNGINIGAITSPDANANHVAVNIGSGWDSDIKFADTSGSVVFATGGTLSFAGGSNGGSFLLTDGGSGEHVSLRGAIDVAASRGFVIRFAPTAANGDDVYSALAWWPFTDTNHTGTGNIVTMVEAGVITTPDTNAIHAAVYQGAGWDAFGLLDVTGTSWAATDNPPAGTVALFVQEGVLSSADCELVARLANGTEIVVASLVTNNVCP